MLREKTKTHLVERIDEMLASPDFLKYAGFYTCNELYHAANELSNDDAVDTDNWLGTMQSSFILKHLHQVVRITDCAFINTYVKKQCTSSKHAEELYITYRTLWLNYLRESLTQ